MDDAKFDRLTFAESKQDAMNLVRLQDEPVVSAAS